MRSICDASHSIALAAVTRNNLNKVKKNNERTEKESEVIVILTLTTMCLSAEAAETRKDSADSMPFFCSPTIRCVWQPRDAEIIFALGLIDSVNTCRNYDVALCKRVRQVETFNDLLSPAILFAQINQHKNAHLSIESKQSEMNGGELGECTLSLVRWIKIYCYALFYE